VLGNTVDFVANTFRQSKNFENRLRFDKVSANSLQQNGISGLFGGHSVLRCPIIKAPNVTVNEGNERRRVPGHQIFMLPVEER